MVIEVMPKIGTFSGSRIRGNAWDLINGKSIGLRIPDLLTILSNIIMSLRSTVNFLSRQEIEATVKTSSLHQSSIQFPQTQKPGEFFE